MTNPLFPESLKWFESELAELKESPYINLSIYVTRDGIYSGETTVSPTPVPDKSPSLSVGDIEMELSKTVAPGVTPHDAFYMKKGRPNIKHLISDAISDCSSEEQVGIGGCGPIEMIERLREAVRGKRISGPSITLHTEVCLPYYFSCRERADWENRSLCGRLRL